LTASRLPIMVEGLDNMAGLSHPASTITGGCALERSTSILTITALAVLTVLLASPPDPAEAVPVCWPNCPVNFPPSLSANNPSVAVDEGQVATNSGTYDDTEDTTADTVAIRTSAGNVSKTGKDSGTWSWSLQTTDVPADQSRPITITARDSSGRSSTETFSLIVRNVPPPAPRLNGRIAFETNRITPDNPEGDYEIYTMEPDGTDVRQLTYNASYDIDPDVSPFVASGTGPPDWLSIAFASDRDGNSEIYTMRSDGSHQTNITNNPSGHSFEPDWSPDGTKIAFQGSQNGDYGIYTMSADGSNQRNLTNDPSSVEGAPAWSPDGTKIAFLRFQNGDGEIYTMDADGYGQRNLTNNPLLYEGAPAWSPDGTKIAFQREQDSNWEIYTMDTDGSGQRNLTNNLLSHERAPAWSPDGTKIAFVGHRDYTGEMYTMGADGSNQQNITNIPVFWDTHPSWGTPGGCLC
jgi:Tol biopolymer transport system component